MSEKKRPPVRIRFKYNKETGQIEDFIIDDNAPGASEKYHDKIARFIALEFGANPEITDAGPRHAQPTPQTTVDSEKDKTSSEEKEKSQKRKQTE